MSAPAFSHLRLSCCALVLLFVSLSAEAQKLSRRKIKKLVESSPVLKAHFTGFALYDEGRGKMIYELNSDKYFIPASNTKLFTFYTALEMLGDSVPALRYVNRGDSLIFWGTGDPSLLHADRVSNKVIDFLKQSNRRLFYSAGNYSGRFFGRGWPLDDYNEYYQTEISALPLYGNVALFKADESGGLKVQPGVLSAALKHDPRLQGRTFEVQRDVFRNEFLHPGLPVPANYRQEVPLKTGDELTLTLLRDTLKKAVQLVYKPMPADALTVYNAASDSLYKPMLLRSDNFIAEQLLLACSSTMGDTLSTAKAIRYSEENLLNDLPDKVKWVDGSGLSRYNLFTPRSLVALLLKIERKVNDNQRLQNMLPAGGLTGTLRTAYKTDAGRPFVWAKTGSLSNNVNQSGYLITRKGKRLVFSFMNNNFIGPSSDVRAEMVRVITEIHNRF